MDAPQRLPDSPAQAWARALRNIAIVQSGNTPTLGALIDSAAMKSPTQIALLGEASRLTYADLAALKNRFGQWWLRNGGTAAPAVALFMPNCPEYVAIWLGITQAGGVAALINTNLTGDALLQAMQCSAAADIITDPSLLGVVAAIAPRLSARIWVLGASDTMPQGLRSLDPHLYSSAPPAERHAPGSLTALLIFTSGTTGMPKAARISHDRILEWSLWFAGMMNIGAADRLYNCLPLYHSTGGVAVLGAVLVSGGMAVLRQRFSARRFWDDVIDNHCTLFLYIGELCRYLADAPPHQREQLHALRLCCGNGLQADVWQRFTSRFNIPQTLEFYASTEGNVSLYNCEGQPGAIGRVPPFLRHRFPVALIEYDSQTGKARRDAKGLCIRCQPGDIGEAIGMINAGQASGPGSFEGYTDQDATEAKILRGAFAPGDAWFRTGDLMRQDGAGFWYFVDRLGDTYRWKGENVATAQVEAAIRTCPGVTGAVVYGVAVPGEEGRVGMAALTVGPEFSPGRLYTVLAAALPGYARPAYLRICATLEVTGTFKPVKTRLVQQGYDGALVTDPLFVEDRGAATYRERKIGGTVPVPPNPPSFD